MNENELHPRGPERAGEGELPDALRWQLRALRRDQPPERDLWAGIAARLGEQAPAGTESPSARVEPAAARPAPEPAAIVALPRPAAARRNWMAPLALAASVAALAVGIGAHFHAQGPAAPAAEAVAGRGAAAQAAAPSLVQREAQGMTLQYQAALREVEPVSSATVAMKPAFDDLDRNAALILDALSHDPDSRMLLEQLRRTYARRLALAQRLAYT
ncbi:hypothetical protein SAMN04487939_105207 [Lysobacter sp. yr284]|uniref:hypothetical protein n=1 Tax=Lysobacter sp. yr284 TaxID=1761791 RepID=UPI00089D8E3E|nr:hypothetical protein [Lysobacter sp. yr284]SDY72584.1 hypothetical protein SAMN04487939_105207 [Lysobacter sp. yr284]